jgi:hypothetical protein
MGSRLVPVKAAKRDGTLFKGFVIEEKIGATLYNRACLYYKMDYNKDMIIKLPTLECQKCRHKWTPRKTDVRLCPKCHTPLWDKPREK